MSDNNRGSIFGNKSDSESDGKPAEGGETQSKPAAERRLETAAKQFAATETEKAPLVTGASEELKESDRAAATSVSGEEAGQKAVDTVAESKPGVIPQFGKHGGQDENDPLTTDSQVHSLQQGAEEQSALSAVIPNATDTAIAVGELPEPVEGEQQYSSHPIPQFRIGNFQFDKGVLRLTGDDVTRFEKLMESASPRDKALVKKIDRNAADVVARSFIESKRTRGVDTSVDRPGAA